MQNSKSTAFFIRQAENADSQQIFELCVQLGYTVDQQQVMKTLSQFEQDLNQQVFVAMVDHKVMAWIHVFVSFRVESERFAEIGGMVVDQAVRAQGVGSQLIEHVSHWAIKQGILKLRVRCADQRIDAHEFYLGRGMTKVKNQLVFDKQLRLQ